MNDPCSGSCSSKRATPYTDKDALWAIKTIKEYLPAAVSNGGDVKAREMMAYAQYSAGMAFSNAGLGIIHAMAHALGGRFGLPHGLCNAILLPYGMEFNGTDKITSREFKKIAAALALPGADSMTGFQASTASAAYLREFSALLGLPQRLRDMEVNPEILMNWQRQPWKIRAWMIIPLNLQRNRWKMCTGELTSYGKSFCLVL